MFEPVGVSLGEVKRSEPLWGEVCRALAALHAAGIWHGDPRLPNIVRIAATKPRAGATATRLTSASSPAAAAETELVWIDFRTSFHSATPFDVCFDSRVLLQSFFVHLSKEDPRFDRLAKQYSAMLDTLRGGGASSMSELSVWCQQAWSELHVALR
jgi:tRNA A-37 threonylcarbamoyl transferase component Bud32